MKAPFVYKLTACCLFLMGFAVHLTNVVIGPDRLVANAFTPRVEIVFSVMMIVGCGALRQDRTNAGLLAGGRRPAARGTMRTTSQRGFDLCVSAVARLFGSQTAKAQDAAITNVRIIVGGGR